VKTLRTAVIGAGHLGRHHARLHAADPRAKLVAVVDSDPARAREVAGPLGAEALEDPSQLQGRVDAVSVAVPTIAHATVARPFLEAGVHVLVEKPITRTEAEARDLIETARKAGAVLVVGHTERFNPAVQALAERVKRPRFIETHRLGGFSARSTDIDVVLDLMIHDLDAVRSLVGAGATAVEAVGVGALTNSVDIANARVTFEGGCVANMTASRISAQKIRKLRVFESRAYFSLDYAERSLEHFWLHLEPGGKPEIRREQVPVPADEPLRREIEAFFAAALGEKPPVVPGEDGLEALRLAGLVLGAIARSAAQQDLKEPNTATP
jgi:predicted dehydrogenase